MDRVAFRKVEELPLVLTPMDIAAVLGISRNTAYELHPQRGLSHPSGRQAISSKQEAVSDLVRRPGSIRNGGI